MRITPLLCFFVVLFCAQNHAGFVMVFAALPLLPWFVCKLIAAVRHPQRRGVICAVAMLWLVSFVIVATSHLYLFRSSRREAQAIAKSIELYGEQHGSCPRDLAVLGIDASATEDILIVRPR